MRRVAPLRGLSLPVDDSLSEHEISEMLAAGRISPERAQQILSRKKELSQQSSRDYDSSRN